MTDVTLHLKDTATGLCLVCGADLQQRVSHWWLVNCWTADPKHFHAQETNLPGETAIPCGALANSNQTNAGNERTPLAGGPLD